jgi:hypothetical protein
VEGIKRGIHVDVTAGIHHKAFVKKVPISSDLSFHVALSNCLRLRSVVALGRVADSEKLRDQVFDFLSGGEWHFADCTAYVEKVRARAARQNRHSWGDFDAEIFSGVVSRRSATLSPSGHPRPSRQQAGAAKSTHKLPQDVFDNLRAKGYCLAFNKEGCDEASPHQCKGRRNSKLKVSHHCALCDGAHGYHSCRHA